MSIVNPCQYIDHFPLPFIWMQEKIGKKENGEKENEKEIIDERICILFLYLIEEKIEKKENTRESLFSCLVEKSEKKKKLI